MQSWKTRSRRTILEHSRFLVVEEHTVELPDGRIIEDWPWVITPDFVNVVVITEGGEFLCFRQSKYAVEGITLAPVGGYLEVGEDPLDAAKRELLEEAGCEASDWVSLGQYAVDGNRGAGTAHLFLAHGARRVAEIDSDDLEEMELISMSSDEIEAALDDGAFKLLPWVAVVALALRALEGGC
jgi:8-oxo-dGTP pyrophosphatase MutT (NUDIX family)